MKLNDIFPSSYLKADDLQGNQVRVTIDRITLEDFGDDGRKPVLHFAGKDKSLPLNKTNANTIADQHGAETDDWIGQSIVLFPSQTDFQGRQVACIRVKLLDHVTQTEAKQPPPAQQMTQDDIPF